jgi:transposase
MSLADLTPVRGLTTREVAARYRISEDRVRGWIRAGQLCAVNTADAKCARPRFVVLPEALAAFERLRAAADPPKPTRAKRRVVVDYFPGD